jgi:hypothetical protein
MASPVVFALTWAQARVLNDITTRRFHIYPNLRALNTLEARRLVRRRGSTYALTPAGKAARALVRALALHKDLPDAPARPHPFAGLDTRDQ